MRHRQLILATLVCALASAILSAQEDVPQEFSPAPLANLPQALNSTTTAAHVQRPPARTPGHHFYASVRRHPLTPREVSMRDAVESLGIDKHRFVRCELKDGSQFVGGIDDIQFAYFRISKGILNNREINYSELEQAPQPIPAVGEHLVNGLQWTGLVAACVVFSPLVVIFYPLVLAGVITD